MSAISTSRLKDVTTGHIKRHAGGCVWEVPEA